MFPPGNPPRRKTNPSWFSAFLSGSGPEGKFPPPSPEPARWSDIKPRLGWRIAALVALLLCTACDGGGAHRCGPADNQRTPSALSDARDACAMISAVQNAAYPALEGFTVDVEPFEHESAFFRAQPHVTSTLNALGDATYVIEVNASVYEAALESEPARAVLAHELAHLEQYVLHGFLGMGDALYGEANLDHLVHNERQTDLRALEAGYAPGLIAFRRWLYARLDGKALETKRTVYFTPEEIEALEAIRVSDPERFAAFMDDPPRALDDIR